MEDGGAQGKAAAGEEEESVLGPAPRGCESPWYVIACINVFFLFPEEFNSDACCLYSVLGKKERERSPRRSGPMRSSEAEAQVLNASFLEKARPAPSPSRRWSPQPRPTC